MRFIPDTERWCNPCKSMRNTTLTEWKTKITIISTDAEKAFDKIHHSFMIKIHRTKVQQNKKGQTWQACS